MYRSKPIMKPPLINYKPLIRDYMQQWQYYFNSEQIHPNVVPGWYPVSVDPYSGCHTGFTEHSQNGNANHGNQHPIYPQTDSGTRFQEHDVQYSSTVTFPAAVKNESINIEEDCLYDEDIARYSAGVSFPAAVRTFNSYSEPDRSLENGVLPNAQVFETTVKNEQETQNQSLMVFQPKSPNRKWEIFPELCTPVLEENPASLQYKARSSSEDVCFGSEEFLEPQIEYVSADLDFGEDIDKVVEVSEKSNDDKLKIIEPVPYSMALYARSPREIYSKRGCRRFYSKKITVPLQLSAISQRTFIWYDETNVNYSYHLQKYVEKNAEKTEAEKKDEGKKGTCKKGPGKKGTGKKRPVKKIY